ncbi:hypothetical protein [Raoultella planticola]|uniref:hypothetical protein n=1 Tax=Raoultella planticola TaxID=575 RepID=UPI001F101101|nr:hypothetical protein [Raoultella planticola]
MTDTAANEIAPHLPLLFENEANGILQDPIGAGIVLYVCHMGLALTGTGFYSFAGALIFFGPGWNFLYLPLLQQHSVLLKKVWLSCETDLPAISALADRFGLLPGQAECKSDDGGFNQR